HRHGARGVLAALFVRVERAVAERGGDAFAQSRCPERPRSPGRADDLVAHADRLWRVPAHPRTTPAGRALGAGLAYAPMAAAFGTVGFCWRGLPERIHPALPAIGLVVCVLSYLAIPMLTRDGALACSRPPCRRGDAEAERLTHPRARNWPDAGSASPQCGTLREPPRTTATTRANPPTGRRVHAQNTRGELTGPVADEEAEGGGIVVEVHQQVPGLLGGPGSGCQLWDAEPVSRIGRCGLRRPGGHNGGYDSMAG
ncbi:MAG: transporter, partial [Pseudonocardia sp.]|nr:transporter [Pseudonocardia sp.]